LTAPNDSVFVAGSEPQILFYAKRLSPTRFVIAYPMMIPSPLAQGYQQEAIASLEQHPPAVIVLARSNASWLAQPASPQDFPNYLDRLLAEHYERVGGAVLQGPGVIWQEPLSEQDLPRCSLVLFKRKGS
jgi:hypothetical protein